MVSSVFALLVICLLGDHTALPWTLPAKSGVASAKQRSPSKCNADTGAIGAIGDGDGDDTVGSIKFGKSLRGNRVLHLAGHKYIRNNTYGNNIYWKCTKWHTNCKARLITSIVDPHTFTTRSEHNHDL